MYQNSLYQSVKQKTEMEIRIHKTVKCKEIMINKL